jgi:hypothetical protein
LTHKLPSKPKESYLDESHILIDSSYQWAYSQSGKSSGIRAIFDASAAIASKAKHCGGFEGKEALFIHGLRSAEPAKSRPLPKMTRLPILRLYERPAQKRAT